MYGQTTKKEIMTRVENLNDLTIYTVTVDWSNWPKTITLTIDGQTSTFKTLREAYKTLWDTDPYYEHKEPETTETQNKEEETMETKTTTPTTATLNLTNGTVRFEYNGITYKYNTESKRYAKTTPDGKTTRIGKAEYDTNWASYEQEILDHQPSKIEVNSDLHEPAVLNEFGCVDCSECNVNGCVHRDCMRRNPRSEGGLGECPRLDVKVEEPDEVQDPELDQIMEETGLEASDAELERNIRNEQKKPSKPRRSKDIAYEGNGVTLTAKQVDFLRELRKTEAYKEDENDMVVEDITITIGGQFEDKPMTVGAMISTLCEKHLGTRIKAKIGNRTMTVFGLTPSGKDIMNAIK